MCDCVCRVVQTLHFAGQAVVCVRITVYRCCMACKVVTDHRHSVVLVWLVTIHVVDIACNQKYSLYCYPNIANCLLFQCSQFFLCCHYMSSTNSVLSPNY